MRPLRLLIVLVAGSACGDTTERPRTIVRDSVGVRIVEVTESAVASPDTSLLLPSDFSVQPPELGDIRDVALGPGGELVVLDPLGPSVVVLDSTGAVRARFGRDGSGPGELRESALTGLALVADTVVVPDLGNRRVSLFDLDGAHIRSLAFDVREGFADGWKRHTHGSLVFRRIAAAQRLESVDLSGSNGALVQRLGPLPLPDEAGPLTPLPVWCVWPDGRVAFGATDRYVVRVARGGALDTEVRGSVPSRPLTDRDVRYLHEVVRESLERRTQSQVDPEMVRQMLESVPLPESAPQIADVLCPETGELWVQLARPVTEMGVDVVRVGSTDAWGGHEWDVYDLRSGSVRRFSMPRNAQLTRVTRAAGVGFTVDELGRKSVARWVRR